nr:FMRFamide receptor-like [Lepeophtheirus salmonis]
MNDTCPPEQHHEYFFWWKEGLATLIVGITGLIANSIAIPILLSKKLISIFNRLLVSLAIFDNIFLFCTLSETIRRNFHNSDLQTISFIYIFYPLQNISAVCSIYTTIGLAAERWLAVSRPVEYHLSVNANGARPWKRVTAYVAPILIFSIAYNIPKFFEVKPRVNVIYNQTEYDPIAKTHVVYNVTQMDFDLTGIRMNEDYVFYYVNVSRLIITGIIPLFSLSYLNMSIYRLIKKRGDTSLRGPLSRTRDSNIASNSQKLVEENRAAIVLFFIVVMFLICSLPRVILNLYEVLKLNMLRAVVSNKCYTLPLWVDLLSSVSIALLVINSSINFFVYCFVNRTFRNEFFAHMNRMWTFITHRRDRIFAGCIYGSSERIQMEGCVNIRNNNGHVINNSNNFELDLEIQDGSIMNTMTMEQTTETIKKQSDTIMDEGTGVLTTNV